MTGLFLSALLSIAGAQTQFSDLPRVEYFRNPYYESQGFRLGYILDFARFGIVIPSYEGKLMLGFGSSPDSDIDPRCYATKMRNKVAPEIAKKECLTVSNPWPFSTLDSSVFKQYSGYTDAKTAPVLVYYVRPTLSPEHEVTNTKNFVEGIYRLNPNIKMASAIDGRESASELPARLNREEGYIEGRVVKASLDHPLRKSFEITIQEGPLGSNFKQMSVSSQDVFNYIVQTMLTGKLVRIGYLKLQGLENDIYLIGKDYDTAYRVITVELRE